MATKESPRFNRYVVAVEVTTVNPETGEKSVDEASFSVAAISPGAIRSALGIKSIGNVVSYEITDYKRQNK